MLPDNILQSDMLDILFENRNKAYGAYTLRKDYNKRLAVSLASVLMFTILFILLQKLLGEEEKKLQTSIILPDNYKLTLVSLRPDEPKSKQASPSHPKPAPTANYQNVKIVKYETPPLPSIKDLDNRIISDKTVAGPSVDENTVEPVTGNGGGGTILPGKQQDKPEEGPLDENMVSVLPQFPGGMEAFQRFMLRNLSQPDDLEAGQKIVVVAIFIVGNDGGITGIKILNSGREDLDKEVIQAVHKMPKWIPGMQNGRNVAVYFKLPVTFVAQEY